MQAVSSGLTFSHYKRLRIENVCQRLGLMSLSYLWLRDQDKLLQEMIESQMDARIVKTSSTSLTETHLGKSITEMQEDFRIFHKEFGFNVGGEGSEYESAVFDCPLFKNNKIICNDQKPIQSGVKGQKAQTYYLKLNGFSLKPKSPQLIA